MQAPVQIDWHGATTPIDIHELVATNVAALEHRFGRIAGCRVSIKPPAGHRRTGDPYEVSIHLDLPDKRTVTVDRHPSADERLAEPHFAVNDAFKRARRRLEDQVRRLQGKVKAHETGPLGKVVRLDREGGFGFLQTADEREVYFHRNSVLSKAFTKLRVGTRVAFVEEEGEKGPQASTVRIVRKA